MITDLGIIILNTFRKVLVRKIQESKRPTQLSKFDQTLVVVMFYVIIVKRRYSYYPKLEHITSTLAELLMCQVLTSQSKSWSILCVGEGPDKPPSMPF